MTCPKCQAPGVADHAQVTASATAVTYHCPGCGFEWVRLLGPAVHVPVRKAS